MMGARSYLMEARAYLIALLARSEEWERDREQSIEQRMRRASTATVRT